MKRSQCLFTVTILMAVMLLVGFSEQQVTEIPVGIITIWSGSIEDIPNGWILCNGQDGSPNLTDKFIMAAGGSYAPGNVGGSTTVNLQHNHNGNTGAGSPHSHSDGSYITSVYTHSHGPGTLRTGKGNTQTQEGSGIGSSWKSLSSHVHLPGDWSGTTESDTHNHIIIGNSGEESSHTHPITADLSTSQNVLNPYYSLAYIMYVGNAPAQMNDWQFLPQIKKAARLWLN